MPKPWVLIVIGLVIIVLSGFADALGLRRYPGFGWRQTIGVALGVAAVVCGVWRLRVTRSTTQ